MLRVNNTILFLFILFLAGLAISLKIYRYTEAYAVNAQNSYEQQLKSQLASSGWQMVYRVPLTTQNTSHVMIFSKESCSYPLYINVLGSDSSDHHLLADYLGIVNITYLLAGEEVKKMILMQYYVKNLNYKIKSVSNNNNILLPLVAVHLDKKDPSCILPYTAFRN